MLATLMVACAAACDGTPSTPYSRTPLVSEPPPAPVVDLTVTGNWSGGINYSAYYYYYDSFGAYATLTQAGSSVTGTIYCGGSCVFSGITVSGTVDGNEINLLGNYGFGTCEFKATLSFSPNRIDGVYGCGFQEGGRLRLERQPTIPELPSCIPQLLSPAPGTLMDNGRTDHRDTIEWDFDWTDCPGATEYSIIVFGPLAKVAAIHESVPHSSFRHRSCASYIASPNLFNWRLWLRAKVDGVWGPWSSERNFDVERPDSDPLFNCSGGASSRKRRD